jgi:hypothetical protein
MYVTCCLSGDTYLDDVNIILVAERLEQDSLYVKGCIALTALWHDAEKGNLRVHLQQFDGWEKSTRETLFGLGFSQDGHYRLAYLFPVHDARKTPVTALHGT